MGDFIAIVILMCLADQPATEENCKVRVETIWFPSIVVCEDLFKDSIEPFYNSQGVTVKEHYCVPFTTKKVEGIEADNL